MSGRSPLLLRTDGADPAGLARLLEQAWANGRVVGLADPAEETTLATALGLAPFAADDLAPWDPLPWLPAAWGPAVVLGSGGSSGARRWCLQPLAHLEASAEATATWLEAQGLDPARCLHLNPLPLHHVSGLLPLVRCRSWGAELRWLPPAGLRQPGRLAATCPLPGDRAVLLSLVPTQLVRLLACPEAIAWLRGCAVIWVGGAALPAAAAHQARREGLRLAPCYGATETAAMVAALPPEAFLAGETGCGTALADTELRLDPAGSTALEVRSTRLCPGWLEGGLWHPLARDGEGWWRSGDAGRLDGGRLTVLGRLDGALHSGGETLFPEALEARLHAAASGLPLEAVLLLGLEDREWGERLVALVRPRPGAAGAALLAELQGITAAWRPAERPRQWRLCPSLAPTTTGKWERQRWHRWWLDGSSGLQGIEGG
jgi:O-succinylbenzoic acid--CoA ligase